MSEIIKKKLLKTRKLPEDRILPGDKAINIDQIIRVNHAGEYGAKRIYQGQIAANSDYSIIQELVDMANQEQRHLEFFEQELVKRHVRPTILLPIWHVIGYGLGYITAKIGKKSAMACTIAIEETIEKHYLSQINQLNHVTSESVLKQKIAEFREEEMEHKDTACEHGGRSLPGFKMFDFLIKTGSKIAIKISKVI